MNVLIIGVGLIGGSFALALRDRGLAECIEGVEASEEHARRALERGLVDRIVTLEEGLPSADLIVLATPVDTIPLLTVKILNRIAPHQVVMDTGSIKGELCEDVAMHARRGRFRGHAPDGGVPSNSGPDARQPRRLRGRTAVICERDAAIGMRSRPSSASTGRWECRWCRWSRRSTTCIRPMSPIFRISRRSRWRSPCWRRSARSSISSTWRAAWLRIDGATGQECTAHVGADSAAQQVQCARRAAASISTSCRSCGA